MARICMLIETHKEINLEIRADKIKFILIISTNKKTLYIYSNTTIRMINNMQQRDPCDL